MWASERLSVTRPSGQDRAAVANRDPYTYPVSSSFNHEEWLERYVTGVAERCRTELDKASGSIADFVKVAARLGVVLNAEAFEYVERIGIVARSPGLAKALLQPVHLERDGLYPFDDISRRLPPHRFHEGYLAGPDYVLMAHPWFRRAMHPLNNWTPRFVERFWGLRLPGVKKYIALDEDRVRVNVDDSAWFEADTWFGAPFNEDARQIKTGTVKLRPPLDIEPHHVDFSSPKRTASTSSGRMGMGSRRSKRWN